MALTTTIETNVGVPSLYQRISRVEFSAGDTNWVLTVEFYATEVARRAGKQPLDTRRFSVPDYRLDPSPMTAFYAALTQFNGTEFVGAVGDEQVDVPLFVVNDQDPGQPQAA